MEPKPLLFPFLYDVQEATELLSESTSIYDAPVLRERLKKVDGEANENSVSSTCKEVSATQDDTNDKTSEPPSGKIRSIALKNRKLIQGVVLRNEFAKLLIETKDGPMWIAKSQIVQIFD